MAILGSPGLRVQTGAMPAAQQQAPAQESGAPAEEAAGSTTTSQPSAFAAPASPATRMGTPVQGSQPVGTTQTTTTTGTTAVAPATAGRPAAAVQRTTTTTTPPQTPVVVPPFEPVKAESDAPGDQIAAAIATIDKAKVHPGVNPAVAQQLYDLSTRLMDSYARSMRAWVA